MSENVSTQFPLGAARASFVSSVSRKITGIRALVPKLGNLESSFAKNELRLRLLDLRSGAKAMHASVLEEEVALALAELEPLLARPSLPNDVLEALDSRLADLPKFAWGPAPEIRKAEGTRQALVIGDDARTAELAAPLATSLGERGFYSSEVCAADSATLDVAIALSPDVIVLDADAEGSLKLAEMLVSHMHTEDIPLLVIGTFDGASEESGYVALGVTKTLKKPFSPDLYRRAVDETSGILSKSALDQGSYGSPTLPMLADRLARQMYHALNDVMVERGRQEEIELGEASDVTAALWGAIARIQDIVTARSGVRFRTRGPAGSIALGASLDQESALAQRRGFAARATASDVDLSGRKVLIVDDDPAVVWFLADILKNAGCIVLEATRGTEALAIAERERPELILSDVVMPELDGMQLARMLRRDVVLRDIPVCLLSWKEDLLARVRELGANASAYLRKESDATAILARVREAMRPKVRLEARFTDSADVRGRLDGITIFSLVAMVQKTRSNSRISVRDGAYLFEIELRDGRPVRATRVDADGHSLRGAEALAALIGVTSGRFTVATTTHVVEADFEGATLETLTGEEVRSRRQLTHALAATSMSELCVAVLDADRAKEFAAGSTPQMFDAVSALERGMQISDLAAHIADDMQLADLLLSLTSRGILRSVTDKQGRSVALRSFANKTTSLTVEKQRETPVFGGAMAVKKDRELRSDVTHVESTRVATTELVRTDVDRTLYRSAQAIDAVRAAEYVAESMHDASKPILIGQEASQSIHIDIEIERTPEPTVQASGQSASRPSTAPHTTISADDDVQPKAKKKWHGAALAAALACIGIAAIGSIRLASGGSMAAAGGLSASGQGTDEASAESDLKPGQGMLAIDQTDEAAVRVDGVLRGKQMRMRIALSSGKHTVLREGSADVELVEVMPGKTSHVILGPKK